jgi:UDP-GlcNAc:undecaprenyl-phosphate GlcNAc-1-phosphate transferase
MSIYYISSFIFPFLLALLLIPLVKRVALANGFVDAPSARKIHSRPIPLGGGIPIFAGFIIVTALLSALLAFSGAKAATGIVAGAVLIFLIGLYDDALEMGALPGYRGLDFSLVHQRCSADHLVSCLHRTGNFMDSRHPERSEFS